MKLADVIKRLERNLQQPLPGKEGQLIMAPRPLDHARFSYEKKDGARKGAVLILFYPREGGSAVPFIKRPVYTGAHSGQVSFPGGKWEESDPGLEYTAIRETEEEIGIDKSKIQVFGELSDLFIEPSNFLVSPYLGFMEEIPDFQPDPREVTRIIECDFSYLIDKNIRKRKMMEARNVPKMDVPYFDIDQEIVWGATAMMLSELMTIWERI
ncbi:NUDIX hydrolase [Anditalea andensis]|uniref:NUDIX hydrolase n=1 Tax=Anditalea andensis TaxID=1048983 RepID=A0A074KWA9_9BACT|nr:CoA pyrophosphatase [Anditalea andensis]KEO72520.1 NUDIX hydrolase [Anditalea andensis]